MNVDRHGPQDYQSLHMHREAVCMCLEDPVHIDKLLATLARWDATASPRSKAQHHQAGLAGIEEGGWRSKQSLRTPRYTTRLEEIPTVRA